MRLLLALAALLVTAAPAHAIDPLRIDDGRLLDRQGREVVLRGINVHHKLAPFLPPTDGPASPTSFTEAEAAQLRRWGWNTIRLAIAWEGLQPQRGRVDPGYVSRVREIVRMAGRHGLYVLVDMHQDEYSSKYKGNGAAAWAAIDDGLPFLASIGHPNDYVQPAVQRAFWNFFQDSEGVRTQYVNAFAELARALRDEPAVLGYDLINEPSCEYRPETGFGPPPEFKNEVRAAGACLMPLYEQLVPAIRAADPNHPVFYEDFFNTAWGYVPYGVGVPPNRPWPFEDTGLSFHVYCPHPLRAQTPCDEHERDAFDNALANAQRNRAWPLLSEFGAVDDLAPIRRALEEADARGLSWQFWSLKTANDPHPGFGADSLNPDADGFSLIAKDGTVKRGKLELLARAYPQRIAGRGARWSWDEASRTFRMTWRASRKRTTVISLPLEVHFPQGVRVRVQGARVRSRAGAALLKLRGRRHLQTATVEVTPR
jgi:endoglycosylceramidase